MKVAAALAKTATNWVTTTGTLFALRRHDKRGENTLVDDAATLDVAAATAVWLHFRRPICAAWLLGYVY